ncbi:MAG: glycosyltransferase family 9 protein [Acidobacteriota bacterium]
MKPLALLPQLPLEARVLFIRLRSLGDTILSTPLYAALKSWRPDLRLAVLAEEPHQQVLLRNPDLDQVITIPSRSRGALRSRLGVLREIRKRRFDVCLNLHGGSTSAWLTALSGAKYRIGHQQFRLSFCYNLRVDPSPPPDPGRRQHTVEYQIGWLRALGLPVAEIPTARVFPDPERSQAVEAALRLRGIDVSRPYCVVQPTSRFFTKEWTPQGFAEVCDHLWNRGLQTILTGGPGEQSKLIKIRELANSKPATLKSPTISDLIGVLQKARLFVGNDSGPTHLAAALGIPIVVLFGSSDSQVWHPWQVTHRVVQNPFECNPCPGYRCLVYDQPKCILSITTEQVQHAIDQLLKS